MKSLKKNNLHISGRFSLSIVENIIDIPIEHEKNVCGEFDKFLKKIERTLNVTMIARDGSIKIIGAQAQAAKAKAVFGALLELSKRGTQISEQNVDYAISLSFSAGSSTFFTPDFSSLKIIPCFARTSLIL